MRYTTILIAVILMMLNNAHAHNFNKVEAVAPSSASFSATSIAKVKKVLTENGIEYNWPKDLCVQKDRYAANTLEYRLQHLLRAMDNPEVRTIWSIRGGYSAADLMPFLLQQSSRPQKIYIGYSDATVLHLFLNQKWGWQTVHGPMLMELNPDYAKDNRGEAKSPENFKHILQLLKGAKSLEYKQVLTPVNDLAKAQKRVISGPTTGGNLTVITSTLGTPWPIENDGKVLIVEEVKENMYKVDRMLMQLFYAGKLDNIKALVLGDLTPAPSEKEYFEELMAFTISKLSARLKVPIYRTNIFGHGANNRPFIYGATAKIEGRNIGFYDINLLAR